MNWPATIANSLWIGSSVPAWLKFQRARHDPAGAQQQVLRGMLERNAGCAYGEAHDLAGVRSYAEFAQRVPLAEYDDVAPWVERIRRGETRVLTCDPVTHLIPTSGSSGARKLIPFTTGLQREFNAAVGPWMVDLARQHPAILGGPPYWSISPALQPAESEPSAVPIGFADDASYLGGVKSRLVRAAMVVPNELRRVADAGEFRCRTLLALLCQRDLRLISVWHPSFLALLLEALPEHWERLLAEISKTRRHRVRELERADPCQPQTLWPKLAVISCWGEAQAEFALADLGRRFPDTAIQPKGLLATEAVVTIPSQGAHPLAVRSHFFEFVDDDGAIRLAHELREGGNYEVVVTTGGGLWRYRLGDRVQVTGFAGQTPTLRFLGRIGNVSDLCGEKLSEAFVAAAIREALASGNVAPRFAMLAPERAGNGWRYTLFVEGVIDGVMAGRRLERALRANPHYALCRDLGQLQALRVHRIAERAGETFLAVETARGQQLGSIKPCVLSRDIKWAEHFAA